MSYSKPWLLLAFVCLVQVYSRSGLVLASLDNFLNTETFTALPGVNATFDSPEITFGVVNDTRFYVYAVNTQRTALNATESGVSIYVVKPQDLRLLKATYPPIFIPGAISAFVPQFNSDSGIGVFYTANNVLTMSFLAFTSTGFFWDKNATTAIVSSTPENTIEGFTAHQLGDYFHVNVYTRNTTNTTYKTTFYKVEPHSVSLLLSVPQENDIPSMMPSFVMVNDTCFVQAYVNLGEVVLHYYGQDSQGFSEDLFKRDVVDLGISYSTLSNQLLLYYTTNTSLDFFAFELDCRDTFSPVGVSMVPARDYTQAVSTRFAPGSADFVVISTSQNQVNLIGLDHGFNITSFSLDTIGSAPIDRVSAIHDPEDCQVIIVTENASGESEIAFITESTNVFMCPIPPTLPPTTAPPSTKPPTTLPPTTQPPTTEPPTTLPPITQPPTTAPPTTQPPTSEPPTTVPPTTEPPTTESPYTLPPELPTLFPQVKPRADCVKRVGENSFIAVLGWETKFPVITVEPGKDNMFVPIGTTPAIPKSTFEFDAPFYPAPGLFEIAFDGRETTWVLGSGEVTFSGNDPDTRCITEEASVEMEIMSPLDADALADIQKIMAENMNVPLSALKVTSNTDSTKRQASTTVTVTVTDTAVQPTTVVSTFVANTATIDDTRSSIQADVSAAVGPISTSEPETVRYARDRQVSASTRNHVFVPFYLIMSMVTVMSTIATF